jgi:hypothetical protein
MKKLIPCIFVLTLLLAGGCKNPYVQELLRDEVYLENIFIASEDGNGFRAEVNFGLSPGFTPKNLVYYAFVPKDSERIIVTGVPGKDQRISYSMNGGPPQDTGDFPFRSMDPETEKNSTVTLTVTRDYMNPVTYTVMVYRKQPSWLKDLSLAIDTGGALSQLGLNPGFNPSITDYSVGVNLNTEEFLVKAEKRGYDDEDIRIDYGEGEAAANGYYRYSFPVEEAEKTVIITVTFPVEDPNPVVYLVRVYRPSPVTVAGGEDGNFVISGGAEKSFHEGEPVSFAVTPPFGFSVRGVKAVTESGRELELTEGGEGNYSFIMPREGVSLTAGWEEIPGVMNVRYVWDGGSRYPGTVGAWGDGRTWARATDDLQALIDGWDGSYEIWIARGTIHPVWAWVERGGTKPRWDSDKTGGGWADAIDPTMAKRRDNWCFVLREGVNIYGGFRGTERSVAEKNNRDRAYIAKYETVLSGDMGEYGSTRHLMVASKINRATVLDGFTVADSGIEDVAGEITINGVTFVYTMYYSGILPDCRAGGGIVIYECGGGLTFSRLTIRDNFSGYGSGVYSNASGSVFRECTFSGNSASIEGAALYIAGSGDTLKLEGCYIRNNSGGNAGGISVMSNGSLTVENTIISGNRNSIHGVIYSNNSSLTVRNTLITGNKVDGFGYQVGNGGIWLDGGNASFTNVTIVGNWAGSYYGESGGGIYTADGSGGTYNLINTIVWGNVDGTEGTATDNINISAESNMFFTNSLVEGKDLGTGNFPGTTDPGFKDPIPATAAPTTAGDYTVTNSALNGIGYQY